MNLKRKKLIPLLLVFILVSFSCIVAETIGDWSKADCEAVGGEWWEDSITGEGDCLDAPPKYEVPEDKEDEKEKEEKDEASSDEEAEGSDLAGTYKGPTDLPSQWTEFPGKVTSNEVLINIAEDGTVTGSLSIVRVGDPLTEDGCTTYTDFDISGTINGKVSEDDKTLEFQIIYYFETRYTGDCATGTDTFEETYDFTIEVEISEGQITGSIPDFFTFEAEKQ